MFKKQVSILLNEYVQKQITRSLAAAKGGAGFSGGKLGGGISSMLILIIFSFNKIRNC